jgi:hypothetical protein
MTRGGSATNFENRRSDPKVRPKRGYTGSANICDIYEVRFLLEGGNRPLFCPHFWQDLTADDD